MQPRRVLDCVPTPDGHELVLYQRGDSFVIQVDNEQLMSSRAHGSEEALARLGFAALGKRTAPHVLVGGLGMGFTLRAALDTLAAHCGEARGTIVVGELFPAVVAWNREWLGHLAGRPLDDPRVRVVEGDIFDLLEAGSEFDVVLLDVDNGPDAMTVNSNRRLYNDRGISRLRAALAEGGVLALWSAGDDPRFAHRLHRAGFDVSVHHVSARPGGKGGRHVVFVGRRE